MNYLEFEIVEFIPHKPDDKSSFYAIKLLDKPFSEAEEFFEKYIDVENGKIDIIYSNIERMTKRGIFEGFFNDKESKIEDNISCIRVGDIRLYCLRYGKVAVVLGGGDYKHVRSYQDSDELYDHVKLLQKACKQIDKRIEDKEIKITNNSIEGNLNFKKE